MSIRKISSLVGAFAVTLCLTGCGGRSTIEEPNETRAHRWGAKGEISKDKQEVRLLVDNEADENTEEELD